MRVFIVTLTQDGKWHCFDEVGDIPMHHLLPRNYYEEQASRDIRILVNGSSQPWHTAEDKHIFACATHANNRYQALKLANSYYNKHLLASETNCQNRMLQITLEVEEG